MRPLLALLLLTSCTHPGNAPQAPSPSPSAAVSAAPSAMPPIRVGAVVTVARAQEASACMRRAGRESDALAIDSLISIYNNRKASLGEGIAAQAYLTSAASAISNYNASHDPDC